jgi:cytochrome c-type biogenesis protein CcmH
VTRARIALALAVVVLTAAAIGAAPALAACPQTSLPEIESEVMCPVCGTPLNTADAPQAERERVFIRGLIAECLSEDEIKARLVDQFGAGVLALPEEEGFNLSAYLVPAAVGLLAVGVVVVLLVRWRRRPAPASGVDAAEADGPEPPPGTEDERRRLEADLRRYDA